MSDKKNEVEQELAEEDLSKDVYEKSIEEPGVVDEGREKSEKESESEKEEDIVEERIYTIPLGKVWISPRKKHSPKALRIIRQFVIKHMKISKDSIRITNTVNERIWKKGIEKPPRKIRVRITRSSEGFVTVNLAEGK